MDSQNSIEVKDVQKVFRVHMEASHQLKDAIILRNRDKVQLRHVLNGISFNVKKGEAVALIGKNGCGKSTTLKLLTRILKPDVGTIKMQGRVSSLIELGAGFHPDMSGRENVYINASIFGIKRKEVDKRIDDIIRFSELEEFIDNPVRTYSSGMYMRLAFAVAINVDADILLIDEILAVGDAAFQEKCFNKLQSLKKKGVTIVIVSHSMDQVKSICDRAIWIYDGLIREDGDTESVCNHYMVDMDSSRIERDQYEQNMINGDDSKSSEPVDEETTVEHINKIILQSMPNVRRTGNGMLRYTSVVLANKAGEPCTAFKIGDEINIECSYKCKEEGIPVNFEFGLVRDDGVQCYITSTLLSCDKYLETKSSGKLSCTLPSNNLLKGRYYLEVRAFGKDEELYDGFNDFIQFEVDTDKVSEQGIFHMEHEWNIE